MGIPNPRDVLKQIKGASIVCDLCEEEILSLQMISAIYSRKITDMIAKEQVTEKKVLIIHNGTALCGARTLRQTLCWAWGCGVLC